MTATGVSLDGTLKYHLSSLQRCHRIDIDGHLSVVFYVFGVEVLCELLVPINVHFIQIYEPKDASYALINILYYLIFHQWRKARRLDGLQQMEIL